jgi:Flp pilus assembly pilin Flp
MNAPFKKKVSFRNNRLSRRGQTLVEYALILAYISVVSMQVLDYLGFATTQQIAYVNCVAIVANTNNQSLPAAANESAEMTAVNNYLLTAFKRYPSSWSGPAIITIQNKISGIVYSQS